jgi:hypothetical protein
VPVSGEVGSRFAAPVAELIQAEELKLLESAALALRGDQTAAEWEAASLARIRLWRTQADRLVAGAAAKLAVAVRAALAGAQAEGAAVALADIPGRTVDPPDGERGLRLSQDRLGAQLAATLQQTPRLLEAVLREAVRAGVDEVRAGRVTRPQASQQVFNRLALQGITGFRDKAGRNWSLSSYCEMAVRTETQARALAAGDASIRALGLTQVVVSDSPRECDICRPFEGEVLLLDGSGPGTLADARAKGFQHPNCTHSYSAYIPGTTKLTPAKANPEGYEQKQRQREMERHVREWKRREALALDPAAKAAARDKVKAWQGQLRKHVAAHDLKRQSGREQLQTVR